MDRQAISVPSDFNIHDEVDNSNLDVMTLFESRLIHSKYAMTLRLSTPTIPGYGISLAFSQSKRKLQFASYPSCGAWFYPEYFQHVVVPGYNKPMDEIRRSDFARQDFRWQEAHICCPKCGKPVDLRQAKRNWVVENPDDAFPDSGYRISPFDCPEIIKVPALIKSSVEYKRPRDFYNQRLGIPMVDKDAAITPEDIEAMRLTGEVGRHCRVMGLDMGTGCWAVIGDLVPGQPMTIIKKAAIPAHEVVDAVVRLAREFCVQMLVVDRAPMTETVWRIQGKIPNSFAAVFVQTKDMNLFRIAEKEEDGAEGVEGMRQVNINKSETMDLILSEIRAGGIREVPDEHSGIWAEHLQDNKRVQQFNKAGEPVTIWVKTTCIWRCCTR